MAFNPLGSLLNRAFRNELNRMLEELYSNVFLFNDGTGFITSKHLADGSVTNSKIQNGAVSWSKIADNSIGNSKIMEGGVHADNIADYQVRSNHIINRSLTKEKLDVDEVRVNQGENYPMLNVKAGDSWHPYPNEVKNVILSAKVIGAEKDKIYSIRYIANGYKGKWGISLSQHDRNDDKDYPNLVWSSNIEHLTTFEEDRFDHWEPLTDIVHHSIYIDSKDVTFEIIYDKSKINGTSLNLSNNSAGGIAQGLIIHPMNYVYKQTSVLEDNNKVYMDKQEGRLYVYRRKSNGNYIGIELRHHQKEIGTDANSNHDLWLVRTIKEYSRSGNTFNPIRSLIHDNNITTMDLMIRESSEMDYMGGINHGDEVTEYVSISVDSVPINTADIGFYEANEIRMTQRNKLYRDTVYTDGVLEHLATVGKEHIFGHGVDYTLKNTVTWHEPVSVVESYLGSMAFYRTDENDNGPVWTDAINDISHMPYDLTTIGGSMLSEQNVEEVRVYGNDVSCTVSINRFENKDGNGVRISNFGQAYSKLYASYVPRGYETTIDEVWKQSTKFNFELGD